VKLPTLWLLGGIFLILVIAGLKLFAIFGPAYILGNVSAPCCSSPSVANLPSGMRLYVTEIQKNTQLSVTSIYFRFTVALLISVGLLVLAVCLPFRKSWAWKGVLALVAVTFLSLVASLAGAILRAPHSVSWQWLAQSIPLDSLVLYGAVVFIFLKPSVRALYAHGEQT
jgi:hypothetical protein